jgi:hypothetical protein
MTTDGRRSTPTNANATDAAWTKWPPRTPTHGARASANGSSAFERFIGRRAGGGTWSTRSVGVAITTLRNLSASFRARRNATSPRYRASPEQIREIGWIETRTFGRHVADAVRDAIVSPLERYGIVIDRNAVDALLVA